MASFFVVHQSVLFATSNRYMYNWVVSTWHTWWSQPRYYSCLLSWPTTFSVVIWMPWQIVSPQRWNEQEFMKTKIKINQSHNKIFITCDSNYMYSVFHPPPNNLNLNKYFKLNGFFLCPFPFSIHLSLTILKTKLILPEKNRQYPITHWMTCAIYIILISNHKNAMKEVESPWISVLVQFQRTWI